jgi:L-alanine-DL-glutamate epimerase-like enolase superfamily enzyme
VQVVPHTWSSAFGLIANCQLAASLPDCPYLEFPHDPPIYTAERFAIPTRPVLHVDRDGYVAVPIGPGLGIELDREQVERYSIATWE